MTPSTQILDAELSTADKKKLIYLVVIKRLKYKDVAKEMGGNWTMRAVQHRAILWGISNKLRGGQPFIDPKELNLQKKLIDMGCSHGQITSIINKKFNKNYTRSTMSARAKTRSWSSQNRMAGNTPKYSNEEVKKIETLFKLGLHTANAYKTALPKRPWSGIRKKISTLKINKVSPNNINDEMLNFVKQGVKHASKKASKG